VLARILWDLPLAQAFQFQHCALFESGAWTVRLRPKLEKSTTSIADTMKGVAENLGGKKKAQDPFL
jgi:hypothetical protein